MTGERKSFEAMKTLAIAAALIAGCASAGVLGSDPDPRVARFEQESKKIDQGEDRCISEAAASSQNQGTNLPEGISAEEQTERHTRERDREQLECGAKADREREQLSERERAEYQDRAQEERDRSSFMAILTSSLRH
jgi:hypothetical protein